MIGGRAETPDEKRQLVARLLDVWLQNPELRLGQLIMNVFGDPHFAEDTFLIREIEQYYAKSDEELKGWH